MWAHDMGEWVDISRSKFSLTSTSGAFSICRAGIAKLLVADCEA